MRANLPPAKSHIVPLIVGTAEAALAAARLLEAEGFLVVPIRPPTVPPGTARLRFAFTARHDDARRHAARRSRAHPGRGRGMTAVFITATGTDIGKTFIARGMIARAAGARAQRRRAQAGDHRLRSARAADLRHRPPAARASARR